MSALKQYKFSQILSLSFKIFTLSTQVMDLQAFFKKISKSQNTAVEFQGLEVCPQR